MRRRGGAFHVTHRHNEVGANKGIYVTWVQWDDESKRGDVLKENSDGYVCIYKVVLHHIDWTKGR
eukprot:13047132-Ditylum_brightwellii.AAC.1